VDFGDLSEQTEQRLIEFLNADVDLAFTYIKMARPARIDVNAYFTMLV
jgi:hypothetical protein